MSSRPHEVPGPRYNDAPRRMRMLPRRPAGGLMQDHGVHTSAQRDVPLGLADGLTVDHAATLGSPRPAGKTPNRWSSHHPQFWGLSRFSGPPLQPVHWHAKRFHKAPKPSVPARHQRANCSGSACQSQPQLGDCAESWLTRVVFKTRRGPTSTVTAWPQSASSRVRAPTTTPLAGSLWTLALSRSPLPHDAGDSGEERRWRTGPRNGSVAR